MVVLLVVVSVVLSFAVLSFVLGDAGDVFSVVLAVVDSLLVVGVELCVVVDSAVVDFGVVDFSVVDFGVVDFSVVDFSVVVSSVVVVSGVVDFSVVVDSVVVAALVASLLFAVLGTMVVPFVTAVCVVFTTEAFPCAIGVEAVPLTVELRLEAVEFTSVTLVTEVVLMEVVAFGLVLFQFTSVTFGAKVTLTVIGEVVFSCGVATVAFNVNVPLFSVTDAVVFTELSVISDVAGDCVALETTTSLEELALPFKQTSDKLRAFANSHCLVRFNVVPLQARTEFVLFGEQTLVKFT